MEFKYDGGGLAKGGSVSLFVDGKKDGEGRVDKTVRMVFSADETCDVKEFLAFIRRLRSSSLSAAGH